VNGKIATAKTGKRPADERLGNMLECGELPGESSQDVLTFLEMWLKYDSSPDIHFLHLKCLACDSGKSRENLQLHDGSRRDCDGTR